MVSRGRPTVNAFSALTVPAYRRLWFAQIGSQFGDALTQIALVYLVARLSGNPLAIGLVILAMLLPAAVIGPFVGVLADRFSQRAIMVAADLWRLVIVAGLVPAARLGSVPFILVLVAAEGVGSAFFSPARAALVPRIVGRARVGAAVSLGQATSAAVTIAGPGLGGLLIAATSAEVAFVVDAATFLLSALLVLGLKTPAQEDAGARAKEGYFSALRGGFRALGQGSGLAFLIGILAVFSVAFGVLNTTLNGVLIQEFALSEAAFGATQAAQGLGAVAGALLAPILIGAIGGAFVLLCGTGALGAVMASVFGVAEAVALSAVWPVYPWALAMGVLISVVNVTVQTLFLTLAPPKVLGRAASVMQAAANMANMAGILLGGVLAAMWSSTVVTAWGGGALMAVAFLAMVTPGFWNLRRRERLASAGAEPGELPVAALPAAVIGGTPERERFLISEFPRLEAISNRSLLRLLAVLDDGPMTAAEVAATMKTSPESARERLEALREAGLVGLAEGGELGESGEPRYGVAARDVRVAEAALGGRAGVESLISVLVEPGLEELRQLAEHGRRQTHFSAQILRLTEAEWLAARQAMEKALAALEVESRSPGAAQASGETAGKEIYVLTVLGFRLPEG